MLDIQFIRENTKQVENSIKHRNLEVNLKALFDLDDQRRSLLTETEQIRHERNKIAQAEGKPSEELIEEGRKLKNKLEKSEAKLAGAETAYRELMLQVPNILMPDVPKGSDESDNKVIKKWGKEGSFNFEAKDHLELGNVNNMIDIETAAYTSGSRFYYLKNGAVLLEFALIQWLLNKFVQKGFTPVTTPQLVKEHMMVATGFFPADKNEIYSVNPGEDNLFLVGTAEVPLAGLHMRRPLDASELPRRYVGFSTCFRREAGSYGKDTRGIFRVHQFDKLEMYSFVHPDKSEEEHEYLLGIEEEILQELELPYQVVNICAGDLGISAAKKYDCEVWTPSQKRYREVTSCSNTTDFQARRGNIKFKNNNKLEYAHTLNGTAMALPRTLIAIMENNQTSEGKIRVPKVLQAYIKEDYL